MAPFVMQIGGRDSPDQLAEWRFRIDRIAWIDVAHPRSRLRKHSEANNFDRSPCPERSAPTSRGGTSASVSATARPVTTVPATPADATVRNFLREKASSPDGSVRVSFLDVMRPAPLMWSSRSLDFGGARHYGSYTRTDAGPAE